MTGANAIPRGLGIIILAPFIFVAHVLEESPGFVTWFNTHVSRGITPGLFWSVNMTALIITVIVTVVELSVPSRASSALIILWFSFLMLANAIFHITGAMVDRHYVPGLITAIALYIPYYTFIVGRFLQKDRLRPAYVIILALLGSSLMLIHGYLIIFRGSRLF